MAFSELFYLQTLLRARSDEARKILVTLAFTVLQIFNFECFFLLRSVKNDKMTELNPRIIKGQLYLFSMTFFRRRGP